MKSLLETPADMIGRLTPGRLELDCALRARGMGDVADELLLAAFEPGIVGVKLTGLDSADPPVLQGQYPIDHPYAKGKAVNLGVATLAAAATATADLLTGGYTGLALFGRIGNGSTAAGASGDLGISVVAYEDDGITKFPGGVAAGVPLLPTSTPIAAALSAPVALIAQVYDLRGLDKVAVNLKNNNAGALQGATLIYWLLK